MSVAGRIGSGRVDRREIFLIIQRQTGPIFIPRRRVSEAGHAGYEEDTRRLLPIGTAYGAVRLARLAEKVGEDGLLVDKEVGVLRAVRPRLRAEDGALFRGAGGWGDGGDLTRTARRGDGLEEVVELLEGKRVVQRLQGVDVRHVERFHVHICK